MLAARPALPDATSDATSKASGSIWGLLAKRRLSQPGDAGDKNIVTEGITQLALQCHVLDRSLLHKLSTYSKAPNKFRESILLARHLPALFRWSFSNQPTLGLARARAMPDFGVRRLSPHKPFAFTMGDEVFTGVTRPASSMDIFTLLIRSVTNFCPVLVWNGFSQEHHAAI
jgi:hypothetical protein